MVAEDERQLRILERKAAVERAHGLPVEILDAAELRRVTPYLAPDLARAAARLGARLVCGVTLTGLRTEAGGFLAATGR